MVAAISRIVMEELMNYQVKNESPFVATGAIPTDDKSVLLRANPARLLSGSYVSCELCSYVIRLLCFVQTLRVCLPAPMFR